MQILLDWDRVYAFATKSGVVWFWPISLFVMTSASHQFSAAHHRGEDLVVVLTAAEMAGNAVRQFPAAWDSDSS